MQLFFYLSQTKLQITTVSDQKHMLKSSSLANAARTLKSKIVLQFAHMDCHLSVLLYHKRVKLKIEIDLIRLFNIQ